MPIDLTGGLDPARELVFAERPADPEMRDSVSLWLADDRGRLGIPRVGIEAVASQWDVPDLQLNVAFPDGRAYVARDSGEAHPVTGPDGRPTVLGAGPLAFRCVDPFRTWTASFDGTAMAVTTEATAGGVMSGPRVPVAFEVEATMAVPPFVQGALSSEAARRLSSDVEGSFMGGDRYEQLFRARGRLAVDGEEHEFTGTGLRIRRQGVRTLGGFWGHCWQSALFPGGRAFGYIAYPPRPAGSPSYNEGFVFDGDGPLVPARVVKAPWLRSLQGAGEDVTVVLESERGTVTVEGETTLGVYTVGRPEMPDFPALQQAGARYRWDGEEAYGMLERSSPMDQVSRL